MRGAIHGARVCILQRSARSCRRSLGFQREPACRRPFARRRAPARFSVEWPAAPGKHAGPAAHAPAQSRSDIRIAQAGYRGEHRRRRWPARRAAANAEFAGDFGLLALQEGRWIPALLAPSMALTLRASFAVRARSCTPRRRDDERRSSLPNAACAFRWQGSFPRSPRTSAVHPAASRRRQPGAVRFPRRARYGW